MKEYHYTRKHRNKYQYFRRIPKKLQPVFNKTALIYPLNTESRIKAAALGLEITAQVNQLFERSLADLAVNTSSTITASLTIDNNSVVTIIGTSASAQIPEQIQSEQVLDALHVDTYTISDLISDYIKDHQRKWREGSKREITDKLQLLMEYLSPDYELGKLDRTTAREIRDFIHTLPKNKNKVKRFVGKSIKELKLMAITDQEIISDPTKDKYLSLYSSLCAYAVLETKLAANPFARLLIGKNNHKSIDNYHPFTKSELHKIFLDDDSIYTTKEYTADRYFVPLLMLTSLSRTKEITQLLKEDIVLVNKIWCIDHNQVGDKALKTKNSTRLTPVHSRLISLGFIRYVRNLPAGSQLFPELCKQSKFPARSLSSWFNNTYLKNLGVKSKFKVMYSLKHTGATLLDNKGIDERTLSALAGHKYGSVELTKTYSSGKSIDVLKDAVEQIDFECLFKIERYNAAKTVSIEADAPLSLKDLINSST